MGTLGVNLPAAVELAAVHSFLVLWHIPSIGSGSASGACAGASFAPGPIVNAGSEPGVGQRQGVGGHQLGGAEAHLTRHQLERERAVGRGAEGVRRRWRFHQVAAQLGGRGRRQRGNGAQLRRVHPSSGARTGPGTRRHCPWVWALGARRGQWVLPLSRRAEERGRGAGRLRQAGEQRVGEFFLAVVLGESWGEQAVQLLVEELRKTFGFCLQVALQLQACLNDRKTDKEQVR